MKSLITGLALSIVITTAHADYYVERGTVTSVRPVYKTIIVDSPQTVCDTRQVPMYEERTYRSGSSHGDVGSTFGGAIIGGIIGHAIDPTGGSGVGAIIGGLVGNQHNRHYDSTTERVVTGYQNVRDCRTVYDNHTKNVLSHYEVTANVNGRSVVINSDYNYNVGARIEFDVTLTPR